MEFTMLGPTCILSGTPAGKKTSPGAAIEERRREKQLRLIATGIPPVDAGRAWPDLWPLLEPAYRRGPERLDILSGLYAKNLQLWAVYEKDIPVAGIVTRLLRDTTSGELICQIWLVGGSHLLEWADDFLKKLSEWARQEGCAWLEAAGRKGWRRIAPGLGFAPAYELGDDLYWRRAL